MVKKLFSIVIVGGACVVGACFGDGPTPTAPEEATILVSGSPIQNCNYGTYIGSLALGSGSGYVTMLPFTQNGGPNDGCSNGGGGQIPSIEQSVFGFNFDGGTLDKLGSAGVSGFGWRPQIVATATGVTYAWTDVTMSSSGGTFVEPGHQRIGTTQGVDYPVGIAAAGTDVWVALERNVTTTGRSEPDNPEYPCCGPAGGGGSGSFWKVGSAAATGSWMPYCGYTDRCFAASPDTLYYFEQGGTRWRLTALPLTGGASPAYVANAGNDTNVPVGLDVQGPYVALTTSPACDNTPCNVDACNVFVYDTSVAMLSTLFATQQFGCMDAKVDGGYVYFTIVGYDEHTEHMYGKGIGRVAIADHAFESLALGISGNAAGPRRIYPSGDQLFLVDPLVLARIATSALAGRQDVKP